MAEALSRLTAVPTEQGLDEGFSAFLDILRAASLATGPDASVAVMRRAARAARLPLNEGGPVMHALRSVTVGAGPDAMRVHLYHPTQRPAAPALIYLHGGGWTILGVETHDRLMREYASASGWTVAALEYPLAPETTFPETPERCASAVRAIAESAALLGIAPDCIVLGGDSAGANLAVAAALHLRHHGGPALAGLLLNYGVYDSRLDRPSVSLFGAEPFQLTPEKMVWFWDRYCPDPARRGDPLASPLGADLRSLPPAHVVIAEQDILRDENLDFAARLISAGVPVSVERHLGAPHAFLEAIALAPVSRAAVQSAGDWLRALETGEVRR